MASNKYKANDTWIANEIQEDLEKNLMKFKDPIILAELVYKLKVEREMTNHILKTLLEKIEKLEAEVSKLKGSKTERKDRLVLPEIDEKIVGFIRANGMATAEDIRREFKYRGKNAASARLNKLCQMGVLRKKHVGRIVYFSLA